VSDKKKLDYNIGRPTKYKKEYCQQIIEHMKMGKSAVEFAADHDICEDTFYEWIKVYPSFSESHKIAKVHLTAYFVKMGRCGLIETKDSPKINTALYSKVMKLSLGKDLCNQNYRSNCPGGSIELNEEDTLLDKSNKIINAHAKGYISDEQLRLILQAFSSASDIDHNERIIPLLEESEKKLGITD